MASKAKRSKKVVAAEAPEPEVEDAVADEQEKPKRPYTAYFAFLADFRVEMKNKLKPGQKIPTLAGERWRGMTDDDKGPYLTQAAILKKEYEKKMEDWNKKNSK